MAETAHMLAPVPAAQAMGLGPALPPLHVLRVLSLGGQVICVGDRLAGAMRARGHPFDFRDARAAALALAAAASGPITIAVPFSVSTHAVLLERWIEASGLPAETAVIPTVPPPLMAAALAGGRDRRLLRRRTLGVGRGRTGGGQLLLRGRAIWAPAPDKVRAARADWLAENPGLAARLFAGPVPVAVAREAVIARTGTAVQPAHLAPRYGADQPDPGPTVCSSLSVGRNRLAGAIAAGACTVAALGAATGVGTTCGGCRPELAALIADIAPRLQAVE